MAEHFISREQAENDLLACAAFLAERIKSGEGHSEAMNAVLPQYLAKGDVDLAAELANAVNDPFSRDRLLVLIAEKCAEIDDDEYALQLADAIEDQGMRAQALERIALAKAGKSDFAKAFEIADMSAHPDFIYAGIAVHQASNGDAAAADATLDRIVFFTARVAALQQIAAMRIETGEFEQSIVSLEKAVADANEIEHDEEKIRALCEIGNIFIEAKANDKAIETFDQARGLAELLDNQHRDFFLVTSALGFLNAGSGELADRALDLVTDKTQMASALLGFARDHWRKDEKDDAVDTLDEAHAILKSQRENETRDSRSRNALFTSIAAQFAGFGKSDRAIEIALENQDPVEQVNALSQIARILTVQKEDDLARQTINMIGDDADRLFALIALSDAKEKLGETDASLAILEEAAALTETIEQLGPRSSVLNEIAAGFVRRGQKEKARAVAVENLAVITAIRDESSQAVSLAGLSVIFDQADLQLVDGEKECLSRLVRKIEW